VCFAHYLTWTFQLMVVSSVSPNSYSWYVMALFPIVMALLPVFSPVFCFQKYGAAHPSWCLFNCALQNFTNLLDSWICGRLRVFAGVLRIFAGVLRVILGAVLCIYMRWCWGYENGTQPGCKPRSVIFKMSIVVIVWPLGSKSRQTSRIVELDEILKTGSF